MKNTINICVVGLGRAGHFHLTSIKQLDSLSLHSVVDTNEKLAKDVAEQYNCQWSATLPELLEDDALDAVVVASPTDAHFEYIKQALQAGKHVFTEKPVGHTVAEINTCFELATQHNRALHLGFQRRLDKKLANLRKLLAEFLVIPISTDDIVARYAELDAFSQGNPPEV